jgi:HSP20 family protein
MLWTDIKDTGNGLFDPWEELDRMNRILLRWVSQPSYDAPVVNLWVAPDKAVVTAEIPGINQDEIEISVVGKSLTLRGSRKAEELKENDSYHRRERWDGRFSRTIELPFNVELDKVHARVSKGILSITLPRVDVSNNKIEAINNSYCIYPKYIFTHMIF